MDLIDTGIDTQQHQEAAVVSTEYHDNAVDMNPKGLPKTVGADPELYQEVAVHDTQYHEAAFDVTQLLLAKTAPDVIDDNGQYQETVVGAVLDTQYHDVAIDDDLQYQEAVVGAVLDTQYHDVTIDVNRQQY